MRLVCAGLVFLVSSSTYAWVYKEKIVPEFQDYAFKTINYDEMRRSVEGNEKGTLDTKTQEYVLSKSVQSIEMIRANFVLRKDALSVYQLEEPKWMNISFSGLDFQKYYVYDENGYPTYEITTSSKSKTVEQIFRDDKHRVIRTLNSTDGKPDGQTLYIYDDARSLVQVTKPSGNPKVWETKTHFYDPEYQQIIDDLVLSSESQNEDESESIVGSCIQKNDGVFKCEKTKYLTNSQGQRTIKGFREESYRLVKKVFPTNTKNLVLISADILSRKEFDAEKKLTAENTVRYDEFMREIEDHIVEQGQKERKSLTFYDANGNVLKMQSLEKRGEAWIVIAEEVHSALDGHSYFFDLRKLSSR